jgi:hypothetical protein
MGSIFGGGGSSYVAPRPARASTPAPTTPAPAPTPLPPAPARSDSEIARLSSEQRRGSVRRSRKSGYSAGSLLGGFPEEDNSYASRLLGGTRKMGL